MIVDLFNESIFTLMDVSCPISPNRVNETVIRMIAFMVVLVSAICLAVNNYYAFFFLALDFGIRAFTSGKFSPLKIVALQVFKSIAAPVKLTDLAPKKFAAAVGFIFCLIITLFCALQINLAVTILTVTLLTFAILESVFAVCVGCYIYTLLQMTFFRKK